MDDFKLKKSFGFALGRVAIRMRQDLQESFAESGYDISAPQWAVLNRLWEEDGLTQNELAHRTFRDKTNIARMLKTLEKRRYVRREIGVKDHRHRKVYLTPEGKALKEKLIPIAIARLKTAARGLTQKEIEALIRTLNRINANLDE